MKDLFKTSESQEDILIDLAHVNSTDGSCFINPVVSKEK